MCHEDAKSCPEIKPALAIVKKLMTAGVSLTGEKGINSVLCTLPDQTEIVSGFQERKFTLEERELQFNDDQLQPVVARMTSILMDAGILSGSVPELPLADLKDAVAHLHLRDFKATINLLNQKNGLPHMFYPILLYFCARPFYATIAGYVQETVGFRTWTAGYCPICGQLPAMAYFEQEDGARFLECGLCTAVWRYPRQACPFCESQTGAEIKYFYVSGDEANRVYVCERCRTYLKTIDLAKSHQPHKQSHFLEIISTPHLDILAQRQQPGYLPPRNLISALVLSDL